jgi:large subunit ribosomal protein L23
MALFGSKKNTADSKETKVAAPKKEKKVTTKKATAISTVSGTNAPRTDLLSVIKRPRVTEKASVSMEKGVYVFEVSKDATKNQIAKAIAGTYKVVPVKVRVTPIHEKRVFVRGKWGVQSAGKKAYVYLKKGEKIEIM